MKRYLFLFCFIGAFVGAQKPVFTSAKVDAVSVYFNSAEITQSTQVNLPSGTSEIVVKNVSNFVNENTVLVGAPASVTVMSVQFTTNYISEYDKDEKSPELKGVRDSIELVTLDLNKILNEKNSVNKTIEVLDKNQQISGTQTGLNITDLTKIIEYYQSKRTILSNSLLTLDIKYKKLQEKLTNLNTRLNMREEKEEKTSNGKLILRVMNNGNLGNIPFQITYLSTGATWVPFYDLRADNVSAPINMLYKAQVVQNTGIDWKKVKLSLISGTPNQNNQAPVIAPWFLYYQTSYSDNIMKRQTSPMVKAMGSVNKVSEEVSYQEMKQEIVVAPVASAVNENQLNISFDINIPYDIMSNGKQHSVILSEIKIPATYKYFAIPKMDKDSYLIAEIKDYSKYNLLAGNANIIFEGTYVGKTYVDANQATDTLRLSLGKDKRVSIKREKIADKSGVKFLSSSKEQTFTYDITIKNNKKESISLTLKDQYPLSTDEAVKVELLDNGGASVDKDKGELSWDIKLNSGESKKIRISYRVKYPKDKNINNL